MPKHSPTDEWPEDYRTIMQIGRGLVDSGYVPVQEMIYSVKDQNRFIRRKHRSPDRRHTTDAEVLQSGDFFAFNNFSHGLPVFGLPVDFLSSRPTP